MISGLSRFPASFLEGFSGEYTRPDGGQIHFALCLNDTASAVKVAKDAKRQTLIEVKKRSGLSEAPQVYAMSANLDNQNLAAGIKHALQDGQPNEPVVIEVPNKAMFAKSCEALGMSRKSLIELAGSVFVSPPESSRQAYGGFHRLLGQIYDEPHLPITGFEGDYGVALQMRDSLAHDYARSISSDLKRALPAAQKYVLQFGNEATLKHMDGEMGRYFAPQNMTSIEVKFKNAPSVVYTLVLFPPQFSNGRHDFDVGVILEDDKKHSVFPVMISIQPNNQLNNVDVEYRPFVSEGSIQTMNGDKRHFDGLCDKFTFIALSALEWINSPSAKHVSHEPKQKQSGQNLAEQFADSKKRPFFSTTEIKIPEPQDHMPLLHQVDDMDTHIQGIAGLQSVKAHWQRYGHQKELRLKQPYERGRPENGVSAHIAVGTQATEPS